MLDSSLAFNVAVIRFLVYLLRLIVMRIVYIGYPYFSTFLFFSFLPHHLTYFRAFYLVDFCDGSFLL